ncbi:MAG TPA: hypothetical protein VFW79_07790 [Cellulomonas sp.]|uniref:hypothetical protein n=1 Tax=Cellulomonas sp. TaxID=40001 RepID=UPI002E358FCC|nr:hypothetical protein [Cellulomonas sp.]HEX5332527.1 hypothetical protein [Cellulomonas sp.]
MTAHDGRPTPGAPTDRRFDRAVALCLHAYPQRWRAARSAEVTAVLADLAGPPPRRLDARAAAGLIRGGWATRWREHPPLGAYLAYRLLDRRLPARYRAWATADIGGALYPLRCVLTRLSSVVLTFLVVPPILAALGPAPTRGGSLEEMPIWIGVSLVIGAISLLFGRAWRDYAARRFLVLRAGDPVSDGDLVEGLSPRRRLDARGWLNAALVVVSVAATAWTFAALVAPKVIGAEPCAPATDDGSPWCTDFAARPAGSASGVLAVVLVLAAMIGLASVVVVRRRLDRLVAAAPPQPHRELVGPSASTAVAVTVLSALVLADAWLEATGRLVVLASGVLGPFAVLVLPGVVAAWLFVRASPEARGLAGSDVVTMAVTGRVPGPDQLRLGILPVTGPVPPGTVIPAR